jgi:hypothetical protein
MTKLYKFLFVIIFIVATFLRVFNLSETPNGLHADEASFYINAVSIAKTGADEDGVKFPMSISSLIDPKPALYSYFQIPFISMFEDKVFASRMPSVVMGIISLAVIYLLIKIVADQNIALVSFFVLSISPWHIIASRGTQEVIASFLFLSLATLFLILLNSSSIDKKVLHYRLQLIAFTFSSFLSMYFYHSAKVLLPLLTFGLLIYFFTNSVQYFKNSFLIIFVLLFAGFSSLFVQESFSRASAVGIFNDKTPVNLLIEQIYTLHEELPIKVVRIFYNKGQAYLTAITTEYLQHFSPDFLFLNGGKPYRYAVPDHGLLYLVELPLLLLGLFIAVRSRKKEVYLFLAFIILSPIPAALTTIETPSIIRAFPMVIGLTYFVAVGLLELWQFKNNLVKFVLITPLILIYIWQIMYFNVQYHVQAKYDQPWYRNSPYTKIAQEVARVSDSYSQIKVTNDLRPIYAYFVIEDLISIADLQANPHARDANIYSLGKFTFNRGVCSFDSFEKGVLYIAEKECRNSNSAMSDLELVSLIKYNDNVDVYELLQVAE